MPRPGHTERRDDIFDLVEREHVTMIRPAIVAVLVTRGKRQARHAVGIRERDRFPRKRRERDPDREGAAGINPVAVAQEAVDRMR